MNGDERKTSEENMCPKKRWREKNKELVRERDRKRKRAQRLASGKAKRPSNDHQFPRTNGDMRSIPSSRDRSSSNLESALPGKREGAPPGVAPSSMEGETILTFDELSDFFKNEAREDFKRDLNIKFEFRGTRKHVCLAGVPVSDAQDCVSYLKRMHEHRIKNDSRVQSPIRKTVKESPEFADPVFSQKSSDDSHIREYTDLATSTRSLEETVSHETSNRPHKEPTNSATLIRALEKPTELSTATCSPVEPVTPPNEPFIPLTATCSSDKQVFPLNNSIDPSTLILSLAEFAGNQDYTTGSARTSASPSPSSGLMLIERNRKWAEDYYYSWVVMRPGWITVSEIRLTRVFASYLSRGALDDYSSEQSRLPEIWIGNDREEQRCVGESTSLVTLDKDTELRKELKQIGAQPHLRDVLIECMMFLEAL